MEKSYEISCDYLYIPVCCGCDTELLSIYVQAENQRRKVMEFAVPVDRQKTETYSWDFVAEIPVGEYRGSILTAVCNAPECFFEEICNGEKKEYPKVKRPGIHFTAERGWINDPNGLVYKDGIYHLYYQTNPVDVRWKNMCWGHASSRDLLHWDRHDLVMLPDEDGEAFSGCGLQNERKLMGLPEDVLLFFYTSAGGFANWSKGKSFTQKFAYSLDNGKTLRRVSQPVIPKIYPECRDPFVFWHDETQSYVMALWLRENDFGIFRSEDLQNWEKQQEITLEGGYECPGLFRLPDKDGNEKWFFWAADGRYYPGKFNGFRFDPDGEVKMAYLTDLPYAAQIYSGTGSRTISIPWLRIPNDGRPFTGAMGIPVEFTCEKKNGSFRILQRPVREFYEQLSPVEEKELIYEGDAVDYRAAEDVLALYGCVQIDPASEEEVSCIMNGAEVRYQPATGELLVNGISARTEKNRREMEFILDDRILEIFFDGGADVGTFFLDRPEVTLHIEKKRMNISRLMFIRKDC